MNFKEVVEDFKSRQIPEYMLTPAKRGFICIDNKCRNGSGKDGDGAELSKDKTRLLCGKCGKGFSYIDVSANYHNIDLTNFVEGVKQLCNVEGILLDNHVLYNENKISRKSNDVLAQISKTNTKEIEIIQNDIIAAQKNLDNLPDDRRRGLSIETLKNFGCGYLEKWTSPKSRAEGKKATPTPRLIVPSGDHYLARLTVPVETFPDDSQKYIKSKQHAGSKFPFNFDSISTDEINIVVEGEIDAMSIYQATNGKYPVIATSGAAVLENFYKLLKDKFGNSEVKPQFLILFDSDETGRTDAPKFQSSLVAANFPAVCDFLFEEITKTDFNDVLQSEGAVKLAEMIQSFINKAQENLKQVAADIEKESVIKEKIADWTQRNGDIDTDTLKQIKAAVEYLNSLTVDKITPTVATESKTIQSVAMCKYYDFYQQVADDFLARVLTAKNTAKAMVQSATSERPVDDLTRLTALIERKAITDAVNKEKTAIEKKHSKYLKKLEYNQWYEDHQRRQQAANAQKQNYLEYLKQVQKQPPTPARASEIQRIISEICEWKLNKLGERISVKPTMANYDLIFTNDPYLQELFGFEEFSQADVLLKVPEWRQKCKPFEQWTDSDDANLRVYLRRTYTDISGEKIYYDVFKTYSQKNSFNVVKNYFDKLPVWDKKERAETLFIDFLKIADTPFARAVTLKWLLAAVARIYYPGCNFQAALVLQGNQNIGKSYILEKLGGIWYGALIDNVDDSHAVDAIKNIWICEMKEFSAARKAEVNAVKSFIERAADNHRAAYDKRAQNFYRHCVFAISVNDKQFLRDLTGNRRYWILESPLAEFDYIEGLTDDYIQQIWAEILFKFNQLTADGFNDKILELPKEFKIKAESIAEKFVFNDSMQNDIAAFLDVPILPPVLWNVLTKDEKRKYFAKNAIELDQDVWNIRKNQLKSDAEKIEFENAITENKFVRYIKKKYGEEFITAIEVHGNYIRQETCTAEIYNEFCTVSDNRKKISRINEVLGMLDDWKLDEEKRDRKFHGCYGDQKKIYCRITDNEKEFVTDESESESDSENLAQDFDINLDDIEVPD